MIWYCGILLVIGLAAVLSSQKLHPLSEEFIAEINNKQSTWKAGKNFEIDEYDLVKILASGVKRSNHTKIYRKLHDESEDIPESFDSREVWPECADIIGLIRDQSRCGSCWAFATVEAASDRICIHSNAERKLLLSAQDLLTCAAAGFCDGGSVYYAWLDWTSRGIVTGGLYNNTEQGCKSYFLPPCEDHANQCRDYVDTPSCIRECDDASLEYDAQKTYGQGFNTASGEQQIQLEILKNGPVVLTMEVFSDLANYKSGVYQQTSGEILGGHAVKAIGWGVENGVKYWLIANSWNERWGDNGYFKIIRGKNDVGIEDSCSSALPDFSKF